MVNGSIRLLVQHLAGPNAEPLSGLDCTPRVLTLAEVGTRPVSGLPLLLGTSSILIADPFAHTGKGDARLGVSKLGRPGLNSSGASFL